ncbi:phage recombination protein Bet [Sporosarcina sp. ANT_H38]|uniref:phage recombination protein Bet n=1 Tax=Sporosarcina sp. ANT_H38 TaxID=2597358 RepID=UPI0011F20A73|nr:phage recombination protein Bet [Sporosarcina sp. ANT_H38]KAA0941589.1 phage recombination protein Bet [Sporosarcina sp. ANT_H38]
MTSALMTTSVEFEVNGEAVKLSGNTVKQYLVRGNGTVSDQELVMFMNLCKFQKLNPFLNEAYLIKFGTSPAQIITSKEAFLKRAENHPKYEGFEAGIIVERNGEMVDVEGAVMLSTDVLIGGWAKVYRGDRKLPIISRISLKEFSKGQATWKDMPLNMIRKSAVVNAQREAFPEALGALYTEDEAPSVPSTENVIENEIKQNANSEVIDVDVSKAEYTPPQNIEQSTGEIIQEAEWKESSAKTDAGPGF